VEGGPVGNGLARIALAVMLFGVGGCAGPDDADSAQHPATAAEEDVAVPVDIGGGRHLYLECHGHGGPTIVLESGYHDSSDPWHLTDAAAPAVGPAVMPALDQRHRVCAYDRPGTLRYTDPPSITDRSSPVPMPRTAQDIVDDLHALLTAANVPGPYILVAHSLGGLFGRLYAQTYPGEVRALLFVDSFPVEIPALMGTDWPAYRRLLDSPSPQFADKPTFEVVDIEKSITQVAAAPAFPPIPTAVITKTEPFPIPPTAPAGLAAKIERVWLAAALNLVALRPQTPHIMATGSDHYVQVHQPDLVVATIDLLRQRSAPP